MRVIYDNSADRAALVASSTAGVDLSVTNLLNDTKTAVWRSTSTTATVTATWPALEQIGGVCLPFCNLTAAATIRVRGYFNPTDVLPLFDTGAIEACPGPVLGMWDWRSPMLGSNSFAYGGGTYGRVWLAAAGAVRKLVIEISDPANPAGFIEAARLVCGSYWTPHYNFDRNAKVTPVDRSKPFRTAAGNLVTEVGTRHRSLTIPLSMMNAADRAELWRILRGNGLVKSVLVSLYPNDVDVELEQMNQLYGKQTSIAGMNSPAFRRWSNTLELEEI